MFKKKQTVEKNQSQLKETDHYSDDENQFDDERVAKINWKYAVTSVVVVLIVLSVAFNYFFTLGKMQGFSMLPTINNNQLFIVNKKATINSFDLVYFNAPGANNAKSVRRVIGLPGDTIEYKNDELFINQTGKPERYLNERKLLLGEDILTPDFTLENLLGKSEVPEGYYFVLGDNRQSSNDSRDYGFIKAKDVIGKLE